MAKLSFDDWKNSMSFMLDDTFDINYLGTLSSTTTYINQLASNFGDKIQLALFLTAPSLSLSAEDNLRAFVSLIGLSEERLKRVISMVRFKFFSHNFNSEWNVKQISKELVNNSTFRDLVIDFFVDGRNSTVGAFVPLYYMRNFRLLEQNFINDLSDYNYVNRILNDNELQGRYSNGVGAHVESLIKAKLDTYILTTNSTLRYDSQKEYPLFNKNIDFLLPDVNSPKLLIESSYNVTTGSGQSKRADQLVELNGILNRRNINHRANQQIVMINYCDGFGWVGRQTDLKRIYMASDYVINQHHLDLLDDILDKHYI